MLLIVAGWFGQRVSTAPHHGMPFGLWALVGAVLATVIVAGYAYHRKRRVTRREIALAALGGSLAPTLGISVLIGGTMAIPFFVLGVLIYGGGLVIIPLAILGLVLLFPRREA
jgi:hypothetical protein